MEKHNLHLVNRTSKYKHKPSPTVNDSSDRIVKLTRKMSTCRENNHAHQTQVTKNI